MARKINQEGIALIKRFEGLELEAYQDVAGIWTIGYGHIEGVKPGMRISDEEAEALLHQDLVRFEDGVERLVKVPLNDNEFSALVSFSFNVGINALAGSTALKRLNTNDRQGAADALEWWNKARVNGVLQEVSGLTRRRAAEKALFLKPSAGAAVASIPMPRQKPEPAPVSSPAPAPSPAPASEPAPVESQPAAAPAQTQPAPAPAAPVSTGHPDYALDQDTRVKTSVETSPRRDNLATSRTIQGGGAAGAAGTTGLVGMIAEKLNPETIQNGPLKKVIEFFQQMPDVAYYVIFAVILLAVAWIIYARVDDWNHHRR